MNSQFTITGTVLYAFACGLSCGAIFMARTRRAITLAVLALLAVLAVNEARADTIGLHLYTTHPKPKRDGAGWNDNTVGAYYRADDGFTAGGYCNSHSRPDLDPEQSRCNVTKYVGWTFDYSLPLGLHGAITPVVMHGYKARLYNVKLGGAHLLVAAVPSVAAGPVRLSFPNRGEVHLSVERTF